MSSWKKITGKRYSVIGVLDFNLADYGLKRASHDLTNDRTRRFRTFFLFDPEQSKRSEISKSLQPIVEMPDLLA